ncbi:outer membrane protein [Candidatus Magnetobacterium casense]|uniref:Outer membrane beta-barrel protein n=1 Tax=Candidatus Magnetobacterium casense TaxID=1455061 RepID=A0ABS6RW44_9BACT|nr:outer membrane beta-barrel protein [Candidatus Magnetobacterium casensis]MBV6340850.1 outer membrane beta-barrel protein [Candidatus Magnetobacterium casensis]
MMIKRSFVALLLVMLSVVGTFQYAAAADTGRTPFYVSAGTGLSWRGDADDSGGKLSFNTGVEITAAVGVRLERLDNKFLQNFRIELEYARQFDDVDTIEIHGMGNKVEDAVGRIDSDSYMAVIYYDFPVRKLDPTVKGFASRLSPYVGLGLGFNRVIVKGLSSPGLDYWANMPPSQGGLGRNGQGFNLYTTTNFVFAISPRFGLTYEVSKNFDVYLGAKYVKSNDVLLDSYASLPNGTWNRPNLNYWDGQIGVRYNF